MISTTSLHVVSVTAAAAPPSYPACDKVPSYSLDWKKGQSINFYQSKNVVQKDQKFKSKNDTFYKDYYVLGLKTPWSKTSLADQNAFLSGTLIYLFIDGKPASIKMDICYDKDGKFFNKKKDAVYKIFYIVIAAGTYTGRHDFFMVGFWSGQYDIARSVKVTFT